MSSNVGSNGEARGQWGGGAPGEARTRNLKLITRIALAIAVLVLLIVLLWVAKSAYTDWLWFGSVGYLSVFKKILLMRIWLFFGGALVVAGLLLGNLYIAYRFARGESILPVPPDLQRMARIGVIAGVVLTVLIMSIVFGVVAQGRWETFLVFFNRVPFGVEDPQFHKDMSFHVAVMPMLHFIQGWFMGVVIAIAVAVVGLYLAIFSVRGVNIRLTPRIRGHLAVLGAALMITIAAAHYLDIFELVFSGRGAAPGAGYTDVHARLPVLWLLVAIAIVSAVGFVVSIFYGGLRLIIASFSLWAVLAIIAGAIYPVAFQRFRVRPNEFDREQQFIARAIDSTLAAYNLTTRDGEDLITEAAFTYNPTLDPRTVFHRPDWYQLPKEERIRLMREDKTIKNLRLWDHRPLRDTYNQIQTFRQFYNFVGVDVDRYRFSPEEFRQVMLAGRELFPENLEEGAQNWVNRKLSYTHGFGVAMSPVTEATSEGRPEFFLQNVPTTGVLEVLQPEIYYGENTRDFVIVNTNTQEFDFPGPEGDPIYNSYDGRGGVGIGSFVRKAAFAWEFADFNILISGELTGESRIQYRRMIQDRVDAIAPFLRLDNDPYLVVGSGGQLWWIQDAYTVTDRYAYSQRFQDDFNYIRNSVKVVIDAYNGDVHFLVIDPEDPLIQIYMEAFPDLFENFDQIDKLDPTLRDHIRYPIDLFAAQAEIYMRYHMREPAEFFPRNDLWARAREVFETATNTQDIEPYYVIMKLPGEEEEEFVLLLPFTPGGIERKNLVAWMAARNDGEHYGKLITFIFPEGQVDGPEQIEGRITADETIGKELSLLCPEGKLCIRGNLLAIPIGEESQSILYVEPLYIRAEALPLPELKKVIVAHEKKVVMADRLFEGLDLLLEAGRPEGVQPVVATGPAPTGVAEPEPAISPELPISGLEEVQGQIGSAREAVEQLQRNLEALEEALREINESLGGGSQ